MVGTASFLGALSTNPESSAQELAAAALDLGTFTTDNEGFTVLELDPLTGVQTQVNLFYSLDGEGSDPNAEPTKLEGLGGQAGTARLMVAGHGMIRLRAKQDGTLEGDINLTGAVIPSSPPVVSEYKGGLGAQFLRTVAC